ncbi:MAG: cache domain-containing protein [Chloroflexota bacterium]|nr:cache domain-containing protein [Chloroflexota bacterium]
MRVRDIPILGSRLQRRIILIIALGTLLMALVLGLSGYLAVKESIDRTLEERLALANMTASYVDYTLRQNLLRLEEAVLAEGVNLSDDDLAPERRALRNAYFQTIFNDQVFLTDRSGLIIWAEPQGESAQGVNLSEYAYIRETLSTGKPVASPLFSVEPSHKPVAAAATPLRDRTGELVGLVGGTMDLTSSALLQIISPVTLGKTGYIEVIDSQGAVLASSREELLFTLSDHDRILADLIVEKATSVRTCHSCHTGVAKGRETEVMAFAPLTFFPWGVSIRQSEREALAPARGMELRFIIFGVAFVLFALLLSVGIARSVVRPVKLLRASAGRIAAGNLEEPIPPMGGDELGELGQSLETMRLRLSESLEAIQRWNRELEAKVKDRTRELETAEAARADLLKRLIYAQEEERKRIARELHDETSQNMARMTMSLDRAVQARDAGSRRTHLAEARELLLKTLEGVHRIIYDLRPSILDDLGLMPALQWYAEQRLSSQGVNVTWEVNARDTRLPTLVETALFRIVQEALTNVAKHARAENVIVSMDLGAEAVTIEVEDDGVGFDPALAPVGQETQGLGIRGMKERVAILGGQFELRSQPGGGAQLRIWIPLDGAVSRG